MRHTFGFRSGGGYGIVKFASPTSTVKKTDGIVTLTVNLTLPAMSGTSVDYYTTDGTAQSIAFGLGRDFEPIPSTAPATLSFTPGSKTADITINISNNPVVNLDRYFTVTLSNPVKCALGSITVNTCTIYEGTDHGVTGPTARRGVLNVMNTDGSLTAHGIASYTCIGNGTTDDRGHIQGILDYCEANGNGYVIYFPANTYRIWRQYSTSFISIYLKPGNTLIGDGINQTIIKRGMDHSNYRNYQLGEHMLAVWLIPEPNGDDYAPVGLAQLAIDGNSGGVQLTDPWYPDASESSFGLLVGILDPDTNGHAVARIQDVYFYHSSGGGQYTDAFNGNANSDISCLRCSDDDNWQRASMSVTTGENYLKNKDCDWRHFWYEIDSPGWQDNAPSYYSDGYVEDIDVRDIFEMSLMDNGLHTVTRRFYGNNIQMSLDRGSNSYFYFRGGSVNTATVDIYNSTFVGGGKYGDQGQIMWPGTMLFDTCNFYISNSLIENNGYPRTNLMFVPYGANVVSSNQTVTFKTCLFDVHPNPTYQPTDYSRYAFAALQAVDATDTGVVKVICNNCTFGSGLDGVLNTRNNGSYSGGWWEFYKCNVNVSCGTSHGATYGFYMYEAQGYPFYLKIDDGTGVDAGHMGDSSNFIFALWYDGVTSASKIALKTTISKAANANSYWGPDWRNITVDTIDGANGVMRTITGDSVAPNTSPVPNGWKDTSGNKYDRYVQSGNINWKVTSMSPTMTWTQGS